MPYFSVNSPENERSDNAFKVNISSSRITYGTKVIRKLIRCEDYGVLSFSFSNDLFIFDLINTLLSLLLASSCLKSKSVKQCFALHTTKSKISCSLQYKEQLNLGHWILIRFPNNVIWKIPCFQNVLKFLPSLQKRKVDLSTYLRVMNKLLLLFE